jgi:hypothetical protein
MAFCNVLGAGGGACMHSIGVELVIWLTAF